MELHEEIHDIKLSVARIETALAGDKHNGVKGLAERTKELEDYKEKDERLKWKITGGVFAAVPILGLIWEFIKGIFYRHS